jgi:hypothetical protein
MPEGIKIWIKIKKAKDNCHLEGAMLSLKRAQTEL